MIIKEMQKKKRSIFTSVNYESLKKTNQPKFLFNIFI